LDQAVSSLKYLDDSSVWRVSIRYFESAYQTPKQQFYILTREIGRHFGLSPWFNMTNMRIAFLESCFLLTSCLFFKLEPLIAYWKVASDSHSTEYYSQVWWNGNFLGRDFSCPFLLIVWGRDSK